MIRPIAAIWLSILLLLQGLCSAQQLPPPPPTATSLTTGVLKILVLEGAEAINSIPSRSATFPVIEVRNDNGIPVENVEVVFELPPTGPGGVFPDQKMTFTGRTNLQGQLRAPYLMNTVAGAFSIRVRATMGPLTASILIHQTNSIKTTEELNKKIKWYRTKRFMLLAGAGAAAGALTFILLTRGSSSGSSSGTTIILAPGGPSIGVPR